jgi:hypothetical protein
MFETFMGGISPLKGAGIHEVDTVVVGSNLLLSALAAVTAARNGETVAICPLRGDDGWPYDLALSAPVLHFLGRRLGRCLLPADDTADLRAEVRDNEAIQALFAALRAVALPYMDRVSVVEAAAGWGCWERNGTVMLRPRSQEVLPASASAQKWAWGFWEEFGKHMPFRQRLRPSSHGGDEVENVLFARKVVMTSRVPDFVVLATRNKSGAQYASVLYGNFQLLGTALHQSAHRDAQTQFLLEDLFAAFGENGGESDV